MKTFKKFLNEIDNAPVSSGDIVRALRKSFNMTLKELEYVSGIRDTHLSAIENDSYELTKKNAERLAASLGVHPSVILFPEGYVKSDEMKKIEKKAKLYLKLK